MPSKDNPKNEEQMYQPPDGNRSTDMHKVLTALDEVFSAFRSQLRDEVPKPFTGDAKIAVDVFNDIVAGLRLEARPRAIKIEVRQFSPTEIDLTWTDTIGNADGYRVERCEGYNCQDWEEIARLTSIERIFKDFNFVTNTLYHYRVMAFNFRGEISSNIVDITPTTRQNEK
jgi:hypothetical protein